MTMTTRQLTKDDKKLYEMMDTGIEKDYMLRLFSELTEGNNILIGLFEEETLVSLAGYTLFTDEYAMLGRLRSDRRYRKKGYGTKIVKTVLEHALKDPRIQWICGNTEEDNVAALSILNTISLPPLVSLYAAQSSDISSLTDGQENWQEIKDRALQQAWLEKTYLNPTFQTNIFPVEAYYPFPARPSLFNIGRDHWRFFENADQTRYLITWLEEKGENYLHVIYPWSDFTEQEGFFDTINTLFIEAKENDQASLIWFDLTEEEVQTLPKKHPFTLPTPWVLHAETRGTLVQHSIEAQLEEANRLLGDLEEELADLDSIFSKSQNKLDDVVDKYESLSDAIEEE